MNKTQVKGMIDEFAGSAKSKAGELTGNKTLQVKGILQHAKGQVETSIGKAKAALSDVVHDTEVQMDAHVKLAAKNSTANANVTTTNTAPGNKPVIGTV